MFTNRVPGARRFARAGRGLGAGGPTFAFLVNVAIATTVLFAAAFLIALRRLPLLPAALFTGLYIEGEPFPSAV